MLLTGSLQEGLQHVNECPPHSRDTGTGVFSQAGVLELDGRLRLADFWTYLCGTTGDIRGDHFQLSVLKSEQEPKMHILTKFKFLIFWNVMGRP